jgi:hypothetical protein
MFLDPKTLTYAQKLKAIELCLNRFFAHYSTFIIINLLILIILYYNVGNLFSDSFVIKSLFGINLIILSIVSISVNHVSSFLYSLILDVPIEMSKENQEFIKKDIKGKYYIF